MLHNLGYSATDVAQIVKDAHDVWEFEGHPPQDAPRGPKRRAS